MNSVLKQRLALVLFASIVVSSQAAHAKIHNFSKRRLASDDIPDFTDTNKTKSLTEKEEEPPPPQFLTPAQLSAVSSSRDDFFEEVLRKSSSPNVTQGISVSVGIFPTLNYATKKFIYYRPSRNPSDPYRPTKNLTWVKFVGSDIPLHVVTVSGKEYFGKTLEADYSKNTLTLDATVLPYEDFILNQGDRNTTHFQWTGFIGLDYYGDFKVTHDVTPRGSHCLRVANIVELERYVTDVTPSEMDAPRMPKNVAPAVKAQAAITAAGLESLLARTFGLYWKTVHKLDRTQRNPLAIEVVKSSPSDWPFDVCASTQCQLYLGAKKENNYSTQAVQQTAGKILVKKSKDSGQYVLFETIYRNYNKRGAVNQKTVKRQVAKSRPNKQEEFYDRVVNQFYPETEIVTLGDLQKYEQSAELIQSNLLNQTNQLNNP